LGPFVHGRLQNLQASEKRPLAIAAMNAELPSFKNGEHNLEGAWTIDRVITPLRKSGIEGWMQAAELAKKR